MATIVKFQPFTSAPNISFWHELCKQKLDVFKLDEGAVTIHGTYTINTHHLFPASFFIDQNAFQEDFKPPPYHYAVPGLLYNTNTIEGFNDLDKKVCRLISIQASLFFD
jgi:ubiquitin-like modifier-activating enzyme ATG7